MVTKMRIDMSAEPENKKPPIGWLRAFALTAKWFLMTTVSEAVLMLLLFGGHALWCIYIAGDRRSSLLLIYIFIGAWFVVGGHFIAIIAASIIHRSGKIALLYIGLTILLGIIIWVWIVSGLNYMMACSMMT